MHPKKLLEIKGIRQVEVSNCSEDILDLRFKLYKEQCKGKKSEVSFTSGCLFCVDNSVLLVNSLSKKDDWKVVIGFAGTSEKDLHKHAWIIGSGKYYDATWQIHPDMDIRKCLYYIVTSADQPTKKINEMILNKTEINRKSIKLFYDMIMNYLQEFTIKNFAKIKEIQIH